MAAWVLWLRVAVVLGVAEAFTPTAALGGAALVTAGSEIDEVFQAVHRKDPHPDRVGRVTVGNGRPDGIH